MNYCSFSFLNKRRWVLLGLCFCLGACNQFDFSSQPLAPLPNSENMEAQKQLSYLTALINENSQQADLYFRRAKLNHDLSKFRTALIDIETCIQLQGSSGELLYWKAKILTGLKDYTQALKVANQAIAMGVNHTDMDILFGQLQYLNGNTADALPYFENAYRLFPNNPTTAYYLGAIFADRQDTSSAIRELKQAIALKPNYTEAYLRLARLYSNYEEYEQAGDLIARAVKNCPVNPGVYQELANWLWQQQQADSAVHWYRQTLELSPASWLANYRMALYYIDKRDYVLAESYYKEALTYNPNIEGGYFQIGYIYEYYLGELEEAKKSYQKGKRIDRANAPALSSSIDRVNRKLYLKNLKSNEGAGG